MNKRFDAFFIHLFQALVQQKNEVFQRQQDGL